MYCQVQDPEQTFNFEKSENELSHSPPQRQAAPCRKIAHQFLDHRQKTNMMMAQKKGRRRGSQGFRDGIRTREVRGDGVGEVGVPDVAVALPQLHLLQHRLRLRPRHLGSPFGFLPRRRPLASRYSLARRELSALARTVSDGLLLMGARRRHITSCVTTRAGAACIGR